MAYLKQSWKGLLFIGLAMVLNGIIWLTASPIVDQPIESTVGQAMGATLLLWFTVVFFLSTKNRFVTWLFTGLENVYTTHRALAMLTVLSIFVHAQFSSLIVWYFRAEAPFDPASAGGLARNLFVALVVLALLAKYMKYEHWRRIHRFMVFPYLLAVYHAFFISSYELVSFSVLGVWMMGVVVLGVLSSVYMIFFYRLTAFPYEGTVVKKTMVAEDVTEIEVKHAADYRFKTGQFTFLKIARKPFNGVPHPFSISGATEHSLFFTIKAIGDYTAIIKNELKEGDTIRFTQAYGHMTFADEPSPQVWIAGGIGITPFLSHLRTVETLDQHITLYYSVKNHRDAVHLDYFEGLAKKWDRFTFRYFESDKDGFLSLNDVDLTENPAVFLCGPVPMAKAFKKQLRRNDQHRSLEYEAFSFTGTLVEDAIQGLKRLHRKIKRD